jgi:2-dehydro-3-deoxyphosphogluconate aldolase / (4S)-4-hydroxy-2-oxoglutarate aldolase
MTSKKLTLEHMREVVLNKRLFVSIGDAEIKNSPDVLEAFEAIYTAGGIPELSCKIKDLDVCIKDAKYFLRKDRCVSKENGGMVTSVGNVQTLDELEYAINAGANIASSPSYGSGAIDDKLAFIKQCKKKNIFSIPSALTPSEISYLLEQPKETAPDAIKIFPVSSIGYQGLDSTLAAVARERHNYKIIIPAGGITPDNCDDYANAVISNGFEFAVDSSISIKGRHLSEGGYDEVKLATRELSNKVQKY